jgi:excisionase family DNA binding protein
MTEVGLEVLDLLTVSEVASRLRCSPRMVRRLADAGELERVKLGALVRITPESVAAYKQRLRDRAKAAS